MTEKEFLFVDESGDPGPRSKDDIYILTGVHMTEAALDACRPHLAAFRYIGEVTKEFKNQRLSERFASRTKLFLECFADLTDTGTITATANWLNKTTDIAGGGRTSKARLSSTVRHGPSSRRREGPSRATG